MVLQLKALSKDVPIPEYTIGDRVRYISDETLREWAKEESSPATVVEVKLHMFRQGPDFWSVVYKVVFDTPWPPRERTLSGQPIRELTVHADSLVPWRE
ncbi:hypothetical protein LCGC14_2444820 [marine sediment metagenome]|uniref:Uncharacterized protein n=1 Tax=marine sediment metagenome TaxID=412755 RepID=A0A0F9EBS4_9ZZZZ